MRANVQTETTATLHQAMIELTAGAEVAWRAVARAIQRVVLFVVVLQATSVGLVEVQVLVSKVVRATTVLGDIEVCLLYTSPSPRDRTRSRMPSSA